MPPRAINPAGPARPVAAEGEHAMKKDEVTVGSTYSAKVGARTLDVRIDGENARGGWNATGVDSGKPVRVRDARHLRGPAASAGGERGIEPADADGGGGADPSDAGGDLVPLTKPDKVKRGGKKPKAMSCLDAAAAVLKAHGEPMRCADMIAAMKEEGLWETSAPTPAATLYSALLREITKKGPASRFTKSDRGLFALGGK
jgi:hypothetical protein